MEDMIKNKPGINNEILTYINEQWNVLHRSFASGIANSLTDTKLSNIPNASNILYLPNTEDRSKTLNTLQKTFSEEQLKKIDVKYLPEDHTTIDTHGLLYLPHSYVVPGGRFNEMYAWDSFFIAIGLLHAGKTTWARDIADNFIYQIEHYGTILNANRTYYLGRSQPPLFTSLILAVYEKIKDKDWLAHAAKANDAYYKYWMTPPRFVESIGLSRYYVDDDTPLPESETGYYEAVKAFFRKHNVSQVYNVKEYYNAENDTLTASFYRADRSLRMSGFDITNRFGPFGIKITDHIPIGLNSLLYKMEKGSALIQQYLGNNKQAKLWEKRASDRQERINNYLWDPALGLFGDYHMHNKYIGGYFDATTFYPLWTGNSSKAQARRLLNNLPSIEAKGGILASIYTTGMQWDAPFGWAPHQYFIVHGLANYGYTDIAMRLAQKFLTLLNTDFQKTHALFEKYDLRKLTSDIVPDIRYGYKENVPGFGWTNAVYLDLANFLQQHNSTEAPLKKQAFAG